jgi:hypothetical protein
VAWKGPVGAVLGVVIGHSFDAWQEQATQPRGGGIAADPAAIHKLYSEWRNSDANEQQAFKPRRFTVPRDCVDDECCSGKAGLPPGAWKLPGAKVYPPTARTEPPRGGKAGAVEWEYVFVPTGPGEVAIPPVSLETFDPAEKKLVTRVTAPLQLVAEAAASAAAGTPGTTAVSPAGAAETTLPTPSGPVAAAVTPSPAGPTLDLSRKTVTLPLWILLAVPGAAVAVTGIWLVSRSRKAHRADFRAALAPEPGETKERAAARIDRALREGLARRYGMPDGTATTAALLSTLAENQVPEGLRQNTEKLLADLDFLRFAPQLGDYTAKIAEVREEAGRIFPRLF